MIQAAPQASFLCDSFKVYKQKPAKAQHSLKHIFCKCVRNRLDEIRKVACIGDTISKQKHFFPPPHVGIAMIHLIKGQQCRPINM